MKSVESACFTGVHSRPFWNFLSAGPCTKTLCGVTHGGQATQAAMILPAKEEDRATQLVIVVARQQTLARLVLVHCCFPVSHFFLGDDHHRNPNDILLGNCLSQTADFCQLKCSRGKLVGGWGSTSNVLRSKQQRRRRIPRFRGTTPPDQSVDVAVLQQHRSTKFFGKG